MIGQRRALWQVGFALVIVNFAPSALWTRNVPDPTTDIEAEEIGPTRSRRGRRIIVGLAGAAISALGLWYVLRDLHFQEFFDSLKRIQVVPLIGAIAVYWCGLGVVRSFLIHHLLRPVGKVPIGKAYKYISIGFLTNNLLPLRMGEVVRTGGIAHAAGIPFTSAVGSLAVERLLDVAMLGLVTLAAIQVAPLPDEVRVTALVSGAVFASVFAFFIIVGRRTLAEREDDGAATKWRLFIWNNLVRFTAGLRALGTARGVLVAIGLALLVWLLALSTMLLRLVAFNLPPSLPMVLVVLVSVGFSVTLPSTPGYLGVYHAAVMFALELLGVERTTAATFAIFCHLVDVVPSSIIGAVSLTLEGLSWSDLRRKTRVGIHKIADPEGKEP